jgi:hypothetical protein
MQISPSEETAIASHDRQINRHCYFDRRYFEIVLRDHGFTNLLSAPIYLTLTKTGYSFDSNGVLSNLDRITFGCLVIRSEQINHTTLVIIDPKMKCCSWWNPCFSSSPIMLEITRRAIEPIQLFFRDYEFYWIKELVEDVVMENCPDGSGFCNAYVLKYALDLHLDRDWNFSNIVQFAHDVEKHYKHLLPKSNPEVEFGGPGGPGGLLVGGLGGALVGGALAGPGGALVGGLTGATVGGALGGAGRGRYFSKEGTRSISEYSRSETTYL